MDKLKSIVETCDILLKIGLAVAAFLFVDKAQKCFELQKQQVELQRTHPHSHGHSVETGRPETH